MSRENLEVVDAFYEAFANEDLDTVFDQLDPAFEFRLPATYPEGPGSYRGRAGISRWLATVREIWGEWRMEQERLIDAGDEVVALVRIVAEGGASHVRLIRETAHVWTLRGGRPTSCQVYLDREEALQAAGVAGET